MRQLFVDLAATSNKKLVVVSSWLACGIPLIAYQEAKRLNIVTVGFACAAGFKELIFLIFESFILICYVAKNEKTFDCDEVHIVGKQWGDETSAFLSFIDGLVKIGGGIAEAKQFVDFKGAKWQFDLENGAAREADSTTKNVDE